jgi:hypothetical protein
MAFLDVMLRCQCREILAMLPKLVPLQEGKNDMSQQKQHLREIATAINGKEWLD